MATSVTRGVSLVLNKAGFVKREKGTFGKGVGYDCYEMFGEIRIIAGDSKVNDPVRMEEVLNDRGFVVERKSNVIVVKGRLLSTSFEEDVDA